MAAILPRGRCYKIGGASGPADRGLTSRKISHGGVRLDASAGPPGRFVAAGPRRRVAGWRVSLPETSFVEINGFPTRIWRKGKGPLVGFLAGFGGLPRWIPFLDRLAERRTVIVPSLPGFPGGDRGHGVLDTQLDWVLAARHTILAAGLDGADLVGSSVGASLAAELAAIWPTSIRRLVLGAPFGLYDEAAPPADPWAQRADQLAGLMTADPAVWRALKAMPEGANDIEWPIEQTRANEAAARLFWPLGNTRLERRLPLITAPTLLVWGSEDQVIPRATATRIAALLGGPNETRIIPGAGHLAELDRPDAVADAILNWIG